MRGSVTNSRHTGHVSISCRCTMKIKKAYKVCAAVGKERLKMVKIDAVFMTKCKAPLHGFEKICDVLLRDFFRVQ